MSDGCQLQTLQFLETPLKAIQNRPPGPELQYSANSKFYQIIALMSDLGLRSGLWAVSLLPSRDDRSEFLQVTAPTRSYIHTPGYMSSKWVVDDPWIIPEGQFDGESVLHINHSSRHNIWSREEAKDDSRLGINFGSIYSKVFNDSENIDSSINELLESALDRIRQGKETDELSLTTLGSLCRISAFAEDLEQGAPILRDFLESLKLDEDPDLPSELMLSNLTLCPGISFQNLEDSPLPDLLKVYDQVAETWIATLPLQVSGLTRLAKFKIARKVAVELCLCSIGIALRNKSAQVSFVPTTEDVEELPPLIGKSAATSRAGSPALFSSQIPSSSMNKPTFGLPTPAQTPSLYSQSHASTSEYAEDPAISRLRQYAPIKAKPDLGASKILSQWPETPGVDPATYSWEEIQKKAAANESGEETDHRKKREAARRKRRTERFLSRESTAATEVYTQPSAYQPFGSQPDVQHAASSQTVAEDVPMTQPDRGAFGSRSMKGKKKQKKKRTAGFR